MSLRWKMHTHFPFSRVFVLGVILFFLGLASMIIAIIAFVTQAWGQYVGTGMWGGATVLAAGITAAYVSRLRSLTSVKTFCVCSMIAMFTSLTMLILSAGGLTLNSGFYSRTDHVDYNKRTSNLIHASLLVISVFCLSGSVLAVIVCCKYLFFEHYNKSKRRRHHRHISDGTFRTNGTLRGGAPNISSQRSTNSRTPLNTNEHISRRHSDIVDVNRVQIEYRRSHKRSASDQPCPNSHSRRHKQSSQTTNHGPSGINNNLLSPTSVRYYPERRNGSNRNSIQEIEIRGNIREAVRQNVIQSRQTSSRPLSQIHIQQRQSRSPNSASPKVRLPTDFNEEELPPYEAVEASAVAMNESRMDSGDESDTENSSSTDAHSYNAADDEFVEVVPMVPLQGQEDHLLEDSTRHKTSQFISSHDNSRSCEQASERHSCPVLSTSDHQELVINGASGCGGSGVPVIMRKDKNRPVLSYRSPDQGGCQHLLSVSPEVCAITGESPEPSQDQEDQIPHVVEENFYENGPCYENIRCGGRGIEETSMNHLSKSPAVIMTEMISPRTTREKGTDSKSASAKKVPIQVITHSSPVSNTSPHSPLNSFGSTKSAFRPVGAASSTLSPHRLCSSPAKNSLDPFLNTENHLIQNNITDNSFRTQDLLPHKCINAQPVKRSQGSSSLTGKFIEQGAIPKTIKHRDEVSLDRNSTNMSWKNIPLPLSYNHSESASNELEKKLPSKTIPFGDSDPDISTPLLKREVPAQTSPSSKLSPRVFPSKNLMSSSIPSTSSSLSASKPSILPVSPFMAAAEALLGASTKWNSSVSEASESQAKNQVPTVAVVNNTAISSVREASTQVNSSSSSRWHSHRMGGNQTLLQSRREELHNCQLSSRTVEASSRASRPISMPASAAFSNNIHGGSGLAVDRQTRSRQVEATCNPANYPGQNQPPQSLALRQNNFLQHYPLQPQQPRLGIQLHQRRQQQNQLQQNIESQQQHQQLLQQAQQDNQQDLQGQQGRNGRPLFSVLL